MCGILITMENIQSGGISSNMQHENKSERKPPVFVRFGPQWAESSSGFTVKFTGRYWMEYVEASHTLSIPTDELVHPYKVLILFSKVKNWQAPYDKEPISTERFDEIIFNVTETMKFLKTPFEVG